VKAARVEAPKTLKIETWKVLSSRKGGGRKGRFPPQLTRSLGKVVQRDPGDTKTPLTIFLFLFSRSMNWGQN